MAEQNIVSKIELPSSSKLYTTTVVGSFELPVDNYKAGQVVNGQPLNVDISNVSDFDINKVFIQQQMATLDKTGDSILDVRTTMLTKNGSSKMLIWASSVLLNDLSVSSPTPVKFRLNIAILQN